MNMKTTLLLIGICAASWAATTVARAQVPHMINYQGRVKTSAGTPFTGMGHFKFALVDDTGFTGWSNDGTTGAGAAPTLIVQVAVNNGVYSVHLGNTTLAGMTVDVPPPVFANPKIYLRVWFSDGSIAPVLTTPDTRIVSVGYAMIAATVVDGTITETKLADGAVTAVKLATDAITTSALLNGSVTTEKLAANAVTSDKLAIGSVTGRELAEDINIGGVGTGAGSMQIYSGGGISIKLDGSAGLIRATDTIQLGSTQAVVDVGSYGGRLRIFDTDDKEAVRLGVLASAGGGQLNLYQADGATKGVTMDGDRLGANTGGAIALKNRDGNTRVYLEGDSGNAGVVQVYGTNGSSVITLDGSDSDGNGRIKTQVLEITGGADLSENFDLSPIDDDPTEPGTVMCIDSANPGRLILSASAYDRTVAGIMSGAGGVKPGMLMGQQGTIASGKHPVALAGRVYCKADASKGAIKPGDLLTTSDLPGHAMKVTDHARAQGAILGKAMSSLDSGQGLVLVLVTLQ
jgi:hypothetical protein